MPVASGVKEKARQAAGAKKAPKYAWGTEVLADTNPVTVQTGLRGITAAFACVVGATPAACAVTKPGGGAITVECAAANTVDWFAIGY